MQFVITAYDYLDENAISRRLEQRELHVQGIEKLVKSGAFLSGGAMLDDNGKMIGSSIHVEFDNKDDVEKWIAQDPYVKGKVWEKIDVRAINLVPVSKILNG